VGRYVGSGKATPRSDADWHPGNRPTAMDPDYDLVILTFTDIWPQYEALGFDKLTELERVIFCTWQFVCEVNNGGFHQFFVNPSGAFAVETAPALEKVQMPFAASLLRRALAAFPNPAKDHDIRYRQVWSLPTSIQGDLFNELTGAFFDSLEHPYALQAEYIKRNRPVRTP
jgi:hypothetical protein